MRFTKPLSCRLGAFSCTAVCRGFAVLQLSYGSELNSFCYDGQFKNKRKTLNLSSLRCKKRKGYLS